MFESMYRDNYPSLLSVKSWMICTLLMFSFVFPSVHAADPVERAENKLNSLETLPRWAELSEAQQKALLPLKTLWPTLEVNRKRKWLVIAQNFSDLSESSQLLAQERMREWAALTPSQRYQARLHFTKSQQLSNDEKLAKWEEYQSLNEDEKHKLNQPKTVLPKGAAMVPRPVSPAKLTSTPVTKKEGQDKPPRIETAEVDPLTLLPIKKRVSSDKQ